MAKLPDNTLPVAMTRWLNHGAAKHEGDPVPTIIVNLIEPSTRGGEPDHTIYCVNAATGRRGSTSFNARMKVLRGEP